MSDTGRFTAKRPDQIRQDLLGYTVPCIAAAIRYSESGETEALLEMLPGMIDYHLPSGTTKPPAVLGDDLRLSEDLGLDSLALTEMAFKLDDLFGIPIKTREMVDVRTVGDLKEFLVHKLART